MSDPSSLEVEDVAPVEGEAESSPATGAEPKSMLEAVQSALKPAETTAETQAAESPTAGEPGQVKPADTAPETPKVDDYSEVPFNKHPRFRQLLKERRTLQETLVAKDAKIAELEQSSGPVQESVQRFNAFANTVRSAGLNAQEVNDGFAIMAAMKRDPEQALTMLSPYLDALMTATGRKLDGDLQQKVQAGTVDAETAGQLQRERHTRVRLEQQTQGQQTAFAQQQEQQRTNALVQSVTTAVTSWEERQKTDPDYQKKQPLVVREIHYLMSQEGYPQTPEAAVQMAEKAKKTVEENLGKLMPARPAVRTVTGGSSAATAAARPKTLLEAAKLAVNGQYTPA